MQVLVLSPHLDDAAFSCGLLLRILLEGNCSVCIANVFTVSGYAPYLPPDGGDRTRQVSDTRRSEDEHFVEMLCANKVGSLRGVDLGWEDLPLRWGTASEAALHPASLRAAEVEALTVEFRRLPPADLVLAPKALGGHIDHRLVRRAAQDAFAASSLVFYEDLPYACGPFTDQSEQTDMVEAWLPRRQPLEGQKRNYCLCYPSQIDGELADAMERYSQQHGGERFTGLPDPLHVLIGALSRKKAAV